MLTNFVVTFPLGAGRAIRCNQTCRSAENAEKYARNEVRTLFPQWADVVAQVPAEVEAQEVICREAV